MFGAVSLAHDAGVAVRGPHPVREQPLSFFAGVTELAVVAVLLAAGADVAARSRYGETLLHRAAADAEVLMEDSALVSATLLDSGACLNARDGIGPTLLYVGACWNTKPEPVAGHPGCARRSGGANSCR